jgi:hypothetical protein
MIPGCGSDLTKGVKRSENGGPCCRVNVERRLALVLSCDDKGFKGRWDHSTRGRVDRDRNYGRRPETASLCSLLDRVVAMGRSEEDEFAASVVVTVDFGGRVERITCDDNGSHVAGAAPLDADSTCPWAVEAEEQGEGFCSMLFDESQDWRNLIDMEICVKYGEDEVGCNARGVGGRV